ncbi:MAG TPA: bifunctional nuclease family protein [Acidimicrobiales bacterium]|nr:bifunctional nuclease family protein [Acidimicrobiales bacterium]
MSEAEPAEDAGHEGELDRQHPVTIAGVAVELPSPHPVLTVREVEHPWRELRIPVGLPEGTAIASVLRDVRSPRPLTHDLFAAALDRFAVRVERVVITDVVDGTFLAELVLTHGQDSATVPCRPSDGVALSLRVTYPVALFASERLLRAAGAAPRSGW